MGELVMIQQPRRRVGLPSSLGILGSSKGNTYAVGGGSGPNPAVGPVDPAQVASVLTTLNQIANPGPVQRISATGDSMPTAVDKARRLRPPPPPPPAPAPPVYVALPYVWPGGASPPPAPPMVAPGQAFPGGGGGGGGAASPDDAAAAAAADAPVFLGLTQTQLVVGAGLALAAFLLLRRKKGASPAPEGPVI